MDGGREKKEGKGRWERAPTSQPIIFTFATRFIIIKAMLA